MVIFIFIKNPPYGHRCTVSERTLSAETSEISPVLIWNLYSSASELALEVSPLSFTETVSPYIWNHNQKFSVPRQFLSQSLRGSWLRQRFCWCLFNPRPHLLWPHPEPLRVSTGGGGERVEDGEHTRWESVRKPKPNTEQNHCKPAPKHDGKRGNPRATGTGVAPATRSSHPRLIPHSWSADAALCHVCVSLHPNAQALQSFSGSTCHNVC